MSKSSEVHDASHVYDVCDTSEASHTSEALKNRKNRKILTFVFTLYGVV